MSENKNLTIGREGFALPLETVVGKTGIVGMSGSGKTQTARKMVESMLDAQAHVAVLDPTVFACADLFWENKG